MERFVHCRPAPPDLHVRRPKTICSKPRSNALVAYAYALLRDHASAEDAVQSAFVVITRKADTFSADKSAIAWCRGIVRLEVLQLLRKTGREIATEDALLYGFADRCKQPQSA